MIKLSTVADYSSDRKKLNEIDLDTYVSTDNFLSNKEGVSVALNLPPTGNTTPAYKPNNILVANIRPYLKKIWFSDREGGCSADVLVFKVKDGFDPKFVYYSLFRDDFFDHMMKGAKGTRMPRGNKDQIMDFVIPNFDYPSQVRISSVLSALDNKIENNRKITIQLESLIKLVYDYWFVQFDFPDENEKPYKFSDGKMVWNDRLNRDIPWGWKVENLGDVANITAGGDKPNNFSDKKTEKYSIPIYSNGIENDGLYGYTDKPTVTEQSITISARGTIGYSLLRNEPFVPIIRLIVITPYLSGGTKYYLEYIKYLDFSRSGSVQQQLTVPQVSQITTLIPPEDLLMKYHEISSPVIKQIDILKEQNQQLRLLRDWLLPMLMNGQVTINTTEGISTKKPINDTTGLISPIDVSLDLASNPS